MPVAVEANRSLETIYDDLPRQLPLDVLSMRLGDHAFLIGNDLLGRNEVIGAPLFGMPASEPRKCIFAERDSFRPPSQLVARSGVGLSVLPCHAQLRIPTPSLSFTLTNSPDSIAPVSIATP